MDIQGLKDKILQLAIQGKLVEQDKNDEPASALVQRIKEGRDKLVREGKIRKQKSLPKITEEEKPFEIPEGWEWVRLGEVGNIINGNSINAKIKEEKYSNIENGYSYIATKDIDLKTSKIDYENGVRIPFEDEEIFKIAPKNSILICSEGGSAGKKIGFTKKDVAFVNKLFNFNGYVNNINKYVYYLWKSPFFNERFEEIKTGIIGGVSMNNFKNISVPLPPLAEQKRIVEKVDQLFALIDELDSNKEDLLEVINLTRNQVLQEAIQGKLVEQNPEDEPASVLIQRIKEERDKLVKEGKIRKEKPLSEITEEEKPFKLPEGWEWVRLGEVTIINPRNSFEDNKEASFVPMALIDEGFRNNHTSEVRLWKDIKRGFTHFAENDVAIAKITPCFENRKSAIMRNLVNEIGVGTTELHIIRSINRLVIPEYILSICKTDRFIKDGVSTYTGTAGQQRISKDFIMNYLIPLPPLAEQKRIVEKVDMIMNMLDEFEKTIME